VTSVVKSLISRHTKDERIPLPIFLLSKRQTLETSYA
jgi:hypothetical protein